MTTSNWINGAEKGCQENCVFTRFDYLDMEIFCKHGGYNIRMLRQDLESNRTVREEEWRWPPRSSIARRVTEGLTETRAR